jgi:methylmalonyl-CoA mutase N-terminal domain/subunit
VRARYGGNDEQCRLRFHTQTGGSTLTAQQPLNNVVRVAVQALAATLGGTQSLHTNGFDEALALPTAEAATLALRTQQVLAHEAGVAQTADPLGGSYYVEHLTDEVERRVRGLLEEIERGGGAAAAIARGAPQDAIARSAYEYQRAVEAGAAVVVGVNRFTDDAAPPAISAPPDYTGLARRQIARVKQARQARSERSWRQSLAALRDAARDAEPLVPLIVEAVKARATGGEISDVLREVWGEHREH